MECTNGVVNVTGTLNNTNAELVLNAQTGPWQMAGGTICGGTVTTTNGALLVGTSQGGVLDGVTLNGDLSLTAHHAQVTVTNGLVLNGTAYVGPPTLQNNPRYGAIWFAGSQMLSGNGTVVFGQGYEAGNNGLFLSYGATVLTVGPGITVRGRRGWIGGRAVYGWTPPSDVSVVNQGRIVAEEAGGSMTIAGRSCPNLGVLQATNGGALYLNVDSWANGGTYRVNGGTLSLGGAFLTADLGAVECTNGVVNVTGTLNNTNAELVLNAQTGPWQMAGGTIRGGTVTTTNGALLVGTSQGGVLDGVTLNGDLSLTAHHAQVTVTNGLVLNGTAYVGPPTLQNSPRYGAIWFAGSQMLSGNGTVVFGQGYEAGNNGLFLSYGGTVLTVGPGITVRGRLGWIGGRAVYGWTPPSDVSVVNQGRIVAEEPGGSMTIAGRSCTNLGVLQATNGGALYLNVDSWANGGTYRVNGGTLSLGGAFLTADLGAVECTNGVVNVTGTLNNTNAEWVLNAQTGPWQMAGGTIRGGTVTTTNAAMLTGTALGGLLDGVALNGDLNLTAHSAQVTVTNGLELNGTAYVGPPTLQGNPRYGAMWFAGSQTLSGNGTVVFGQGYEAGNNGLFLSRVGTVLTVGPGITIRGRLGWLGGGAVYGWTPPSDVSVVNQGRIVAEEPGGSITIAGQSFLNEGVLQAVGGGLVLAQAQDTFSQGRTKALFGGTIDLNGSARFDAPNLLVSQQSGTLKINGSLLGSTADGAHYLPEGSTTFDGVGAAGAPQLLEAMSQDLGNIVAGYTRNFTYGTLALANNTFVRLVDLADNAPGTNAEAIYVNSLIVPAGCTLDLNGLHVYARLMQIGGNIIGGMPAQMPDSGPITLGTATPGSISAAGELDEWTFFGRAGETVTIVVDPGSASVPTPRLDWVQARLVDTNDTLLATNSNTSAGQILVFPDIALPADGVYRVQVRAHPAYGASSGNYFVSIWDVTPDVSDLVLNQQVLGRIETPYSIDRWNFSAVAGQQVRFDLVNVSQPGIQFKLIGPSGWIGFSNLTSDSDLINLPTSGGYTLSAYGTGGQYGGDYAFRLVETIQTDLALGSNFIGHFVGSGQARIFRINVPAANPMRVVLQNSGAGNANELYLKFNGPPSRGEFDVRFPASGSSQQITVPSAYAGTWYVLVYGDTISTSRRLHAASHHLWHVPQQRYPGSPRRLG